jgi:hypothetical protein
MKTDPPTRIIDAERLGEGVIITFEGGKCAIYPTSLLYSMFHEANEIEQTVWPPDILAREAESI